MIPRSEVMPMLLAACPSFGSAWDAYCAEDMYEAGLLYIDLGEFARHVIALWQAGQTEELAPVFDAIERLHLEGDDFVREAATIGFLEDLQNNAEHAAIDPEVFRPYLGSESVRWWAALHRFWAGEIPSVHVE
jgi:hypothetical protein